MKPPPRSTTAGGAAVALAVQPGAAACRVWRRRPELASRDHVRKLLPLIQQALADAGVAARAAGRGRLYRRAGAGRGATGGRRGGPQPGLRLGQACARGPSPGGAPAGADAGAMPPDFPFLALLVSGGHTLLAEVRGAGRLPDHRRVARRCGRRGLRQDRQAAGPALSGRAGAGAARPTAGEPGVRFPRPMLDRPGLDFSFSGLKTAVVVAMRGCSSTSRRAPTSPTNSSRRWSKRWSRSARARRPDGPDDAGRRRRRRRESSACGAARCARASASALRVLLSAAGVLHGQRRDDRVRWLSPSGRAASTTICASARPRAGRSTRCGRRRSSDPSPAIAARLRMDKIFLSALTVECIVGIWDGNGASSRP